MAFGGGNKKGSLSEINVTPLVDVMLVLLVVFMVTTPMIVKENQSKVEIDLPETTTTPVTESELQTVIRIEPSKRITLDLGKGDSPLLDDCAEYPKCLEGFEEKLKANPALESFREGQRMFILADRSLPYGYVLDVMARFKNAGITNLGMVTNPPGAAEKAAKDAAKNAAKNAGKQGGK